MTDETNREAFTAFCRKHDTPPHSTAGKLAWKAWQASRLAAAPAPAEQPPGWFIGVTGGDETVIRSPIDGPGGITLPAGDEGSHAVRILRALARSLAAAPAAQPLTEQQIVSAAREAGFRIITNAESETLMRVARAVEIAHGIGATHVEVDE